MAAAWKGTEKLRHLATKRRRSGRASKVHTHRPYGVVAQPIKAALRSAGVLPLDGVVEATLCAQSIRR